MLKPSFFASFIIMMPLFLSAQMPSGTVAKYPLSTNANDISGNSYNGTLTSTANTTDPFGNTNAALSFTSGSSS